MAARNSPSGMLRQFLQTGVALESLEPTRDPLSCRRRRPADYAGYAGSAILHVAVFLMIFHGMRFGPKLAAYQLPGSTKGVQTLTYFSSGSSQPRESEKQVEAARDQKPRETQATNALKLLPASSVASTAAEAGPGTAVENGRGEGDINIALQKYFPYPKPDLSSMAHGTEGDVILDAVIDEQGHIASLTLMHGLGGSIDESVIETVQRWAYTPATKDGVPVASEQELHFHYERG